MNKIQSNSIKSTIKIFINLIVWPIFFVAMVRFYFSWDRETYCKPKIIEAVKLFIQNLNAEDCSTQKEKFQSYETCLEFIKSKTNNTSYRVIEWDMGLPITLVCFKEHTCFFVIAESENGFIGISCKEEKFKVILVQ